MEKRAANHNQKLYHEFLNAAPAASLQQNLAYPPRPSSRTRPGAFTESPPLIGTSSNRRALCISRGPEVCNAKEAILRSPILRQSPRFFESLGLAVPVDIKSADDLETAFAKIKNSEVEALFAIAGGLTFTVGTEIADRGLAAHLPLCSPFRETVIAGGLVSHGPDFLAMARQAAAQIDKIIKGTSPAEKGPAQPTFRSSSRHVTSCASI